MPKRRLIITGLVLVVVSLLAAGCFHSDDENGNGSGEAAQTGTDGDTGAQEGGGVFQQVQDRGNVICGVNDAVPGFGTATEGGEYEGFDIDYCRAVAAAVLGDANQVEFRALTADQRFTALQSGEVDVLIRNTTFTASRDGAEGARFLHTTYFDGQGMMVTGESGFTELEDLSGATVCVLSGTTTELNLETVFQSRGIDYTPLTFEENEPLQQAFIQGRCDAWTSDISQLAGVRSAWPDAEGGPDSLVIMDEVMSKEPLGPVVRDGDDDWADAVNWAVVVTIQAEELEITSENVQEMAGSDDPEIQRLLGQPVEGEPFDAGLGLDAEFALNVIEQVGNYGEIFDRHLGPSSPLALDRGINALWTDGGLQYAPPYR